MRRQPTPESYVLRAVLDLLAAKRIWHRRFNTRVIDLPGTGGKMRPVQFGSKGMADVLATPLIQIGVLAPALLWIECKSPAGRMSDDQYAFQAEVTSRGHYYLIARGSDDVLRWLKEHGCR